MTKTKAEKKKVRKERRERLHEEAALIQSKLLGASLKPEENVVYVLPPEEGNGTLDERGVVSPTQTAATGMSTSDGIINNSDEKNDEDRVELPAPLVAAATSKKKLSAKASSRKHHKMSWQALKLAVAAQYGPDASDMVEEHDGNAEDPFFTVLMKTQRRTVPVPNHWNTLRSFMSLQADREEAIDIIPPEIQALGVDKLRATKDKRANPDQIAFMTCFLTGTPLQLKTFGTHLSPFGDIFYEGKWIPKVKFEPGKLSERLRNALGMTPNAPPPWLASMQEMRRLPPAYPQLRIPGLNAPIPPGAQWGRGHGQWGEPPRGEGNTFLFPGVMDEAVAEEDPSGPRWGVVPPLRRAAAEGTAPPAPAASPSPSVARPPPSQPARPTAKVTLTPTPFRPQAYVPPVGPVAPTPRPPREYVRVQDSAVGATVTVGYKMVPKSSPATLPGSKRDSAKPTPGRQT
ncbi:unnamed protein product [Phytomonas sp. EM1]|nr:unnamed protein product [Phytomonas sp. EM1]|eukprot:CCW61737.1 unnamed protein product [Phytomonas sp. isolate EM1]